MAWKRFTVLAIVSSVLAACVPQQKYDDLLTAYSFRLCMTRAPSRRVPVAIPAGYNASTFELFRRYFAAVPGASRGTFLGCLGPIPSLNTSDCPPDDGARWCKCDMISGVLGTDFVGGSLGWADATISARLDMLQAHADYVAGE